MNLSEIEQRIADKRRQVDLRRAEAVLLIRRGKELAEDIARLSHEIDVTDKAVLVLNSITDEQQDAAYRQIEDLLTRGVQSIFGKDYSFHVIKYERNHRPEVKFAVRSPIEGGHVIEASIMDACGGGVASVIGVLLRVVFLVLQHRNRDQPLILDESVAHLSADHLAAFGEFLKELVEITGIQVIFVTQQREFAVYADKIYDFTKIKGVTQVKELSIADI